jgi:uncharacterized protein DUF6876
VLNQFTGTANFYGHGINHKVLFTDGVKHVANHGGANWLLDEIALIQPYDKSVASESLGELSRPSIGDARVSSSRSSLGHTPKTGRCRR